MTVSTLVDFVKRNGGEVHFQELGKAFRTSYISAALEAVEQGVAKWTYAEGDSEKCFFTLIPQAEATVESLPAVNVVPSLP